MISAIVTIIGFLIQYQFVIIPAVVDPAVASVVAAVTVLTEPRLSIAHVVVGIVLLFYVIPKLVRRSSSAQVLDYKVRFTDAKEARKLSKMFKTEYTHRDIIEDLQEKYGPGFLDIDTEIMEVVLVILGTTGIATAPRTAREAAHMAIVSVI